MRTFCNQLVFLVGRQYFGQVHSKMKTIRHEMSESSKKIDILDQTLSEMLVQVMQSQCQETSSDQVAETTVV